MKRHFWVLVTATIAYAGELIRLAIATPQLHRIDSPLSVKGFHVNLSQLSYERELATAAYIAVIVLIFGYFFFQRSDVKTDAEKTPHKNPPSPAA